MSELDKTVRLPRSSRRQAKKGQPGRRRWLRIAALAIAAVVIFFVAGSYFFARNIEQKMKLAPKVAAKLKRVLKAPKKNEAWNILLVGTDQRSTFRNGGSRADTIGLLSIDPNGKWGYLISVPRDTRVAIPGRGMDKINHAWAFGGPELLIRSVDNLMESELPVHYFFQVDFRGFEQVVNSLGGVQFATTQGWTDGELGVTVRAGNHVRMGKEALALVRSRNNFGGDIGRIQHQQQFLLAVMRQSLGSYTQVPGVANTMASYSRTNMDLSTMITLGRAFAGTQANIQMVTLPGRGTNIRGGYYIITDPAAKRAILDAVVNHTTLPQ